ncbi:glycosyltransferase family 2 protein [Devosia sp.]|uniref:glycosyltransferase family 2 protein n=1 Tax=Devosia sp. TaxID=1871048 RepID=UPI001AD25273|nr:glycosyltransferase family 2 protein [Devosia sp.]MBN9309601.1 glycosyltransferase [Devosia sp.]
MTPPRISVVVPSYNQARWLGIALRSIVRQRYPELELIVIDGGSTDGSQDIIRDLEAHIAYWVSEPDGGQVHGLIKGFARATGDILCWINSDDLMLAGSMREAANYLLEHPEAGAVYGDTIWIDEDGRTLKGQREIDFDRNLWLHTHNYVPGMSMYWRRSVFEQVGGLDPRYDLAMDADLWLRISQVSRIGHVRQFWSGMRYYPEQKNRRLRAKSNAEDEMIRAGYWGRDRPPLHGARRAVAKGIRVFRRLATRSYDWQNGPLPAFLE